MRIIKDIDHAKETLGKRHNCMYAHTICGAALLALGCCQVHWHGDAASPSEPSFFLLHTLPSGNRESWGPMYICYLPLCRRYAQCRTDIYRYTLIYARVSFFQIRCYIIVSRDIMLYALFKHQDNES